MITDMKQLDGVHIAVLGGDIDGRSAPQIQETLLPLVSENCKILLDMSHVTYMSSAGLRILLLLYRQIADNAGRVVMRDLDQRAPGLLGPVRHRRTQRRVFQRGPQHHAARRRAKQHSGGETT